MSINTQYNFSFMFLLRSVARVCSSACSSLATIPQRIREIGAYIYNRMSPSTPAQSPRSFTPIVAESPKTDSENGKEKSPTDVMNPKAVNSLRQMLLYGEEGDIGPVLRDVYKPIASVTIVEETELDTEETEFDVEIPPVPPVPNKGQESLLPTEEEEEALERSAPRSVKSSKTSAKSPKKNVENLGTPTIYGGDKEVTKFSYEKLDSSEVRNLARGSFETRRFFEPTKGEQ